VLFTCKTKLVFVTETTLKPAEACIKTFAILFANAKESLSFPVSETVAEKMKS
jgi:hypothetical protein